MDPEGKTGLLAFAAVGVAVFFAAVELREFAANFAECTGRLEEAKINRQNDERSGKK